MWKPEPIYLRWHGHDVRVGHDDLLLNRYSAVIQRLEAAMTFTTTAEKLPYVLERESGYDVQVLDDSSEVRLRRRA
jgi:hypothetical protein